MRRVSGTFGTFVAVLLIVGFNALLFSGSFGVVREHCLDIDESELSQRVEVDSHWTYILWPPLMFAGLDPAGRCVRNTPAREGLHQLGIWKLPSAEDQVRDHIEDQLPALDELPDASGSR